MQEVFRHLCHLTAGDWARAEILLCSTCVTMTQAGRSVSGHAEDLAAVIIAHQVFLNDSTPNCGTVEPLCAMSPLQLALLNLHNEVGLGTEQIASIYGQLPDEISRQLLVAQSRFDLLSAQRHGYSSPGASFQACERWLDDSTRAKVMAAVNTAMQPAPTRGHPDRRRRRSLLIAAAVVAMAMIGLGWGRRDTAVKSVVANTLTSAAPVERSIRSWTTTGLEDLLIVVPDTIVRFGNDRIGVSWTGPCNRPGASLDISTIGEQNTLTLATGSFPVTTCSGAMPDRWTAVVHSRTVIAPGEILPVDENGRRVGDFSGYIADRTTDDLVGIDSSLDQLTSTLVDQNSDPWTYTTGCRAPNRIRYPSPLGALFEASLSAMCRDFLPQGHYLIGPDRRHFPHDPQRNVGSLIDCEGPRESQTDLRGEPSAVRAGTDGVWSTWDGCLVRVNVVRSRVLECLGGTVRVLTVAENVGEQFLRRFDSVNYLRDPQSILPGEVVLAFQSALPEIAYDTGLRFGADQLWVDPSDPSIVYYKTADQVEIWPLASSPVEC